MGQALYRKYRSKRLSEVVGQEHITDTLSKALKSGKISHAYLFSGPRGVGKTSVARILAHEVNKLDYKDETIHLDIIEIDAASNRRIDEIRDLREKVHISPTSAAYKVYIIDEVHMLTREAFNALLKTLEEPPAHCIFILATTEPHKLPETIISRTQRFNFKPIDKLVAANHLAEIAKRERIDIELDALELLAEHGGGSFRDSIGLLDQLSTQSGKIDVQTVRASLGLPSESLIEAILIQITSGQYDLLLDSLEQLKNQAIDPTQVAKSLAVRLRRDLAKTASASWKIQLLKELIEVPASLQPQEKLEIGLLQAAAEHHQPSEVKEAEVLELVLSAAEPQLAKKPDSKTVEKTSKSAAFDLADWPTVVEMVKNRAASLYTALRLAIPKIEGGKLVLNFQFPLHQKKIAQASARDLIGGIIEELTGAKLAIESVVDKSLEQPKKVRPKAAPDNPQVQTISNIFGGAEVLES